VTGFVARSVSAARFGYGTSLPGFRAPSFRFFVVSYSTFFVFESESLEPVSSSSLEFYSTTDRLLAAVSSRRNQREVPVCLFTLNISLYFWI